MSKRKKDEILSYIKTIIVVILLIIAAICYIVNTTKKQKEQEEQFIQLQEENATLIEQNQNNTKVIATIKERYNINKCPICGEDVKIECIAKDFRIHCSNCTLHTEYVNTIEEAASIWKIIVEADG